MAEETTETTDTTEETTEATASTETTETATEETKPNGKDTATEPATADWRAPITDPDARKFAESSSDINHLVSRALDMRQQLSTAIQPLGKDPTDEQVASYRKATGVPETAEDYKFEVPEGYEQTDADKAFQTAAAKAFHGENLTAGQAKGLNVFWNEFTAGAMKAQIDADKQFADEAEKALKAEWPGKEFEQNKTFADRAAVKMFGEDLDDVREIETKDGHFVLDHPSFVKMLAGIGREMDEGRLGGVLTPSDRDNVQGQIDELQTKMDKATAANDGDAAQKHYIAQQELYRKMYGSESVVGTEGRAV